MSTKFCPDCGAEVPNHSNRCLECQFPLTLDTIESATGVRIPPHQKEAWKRISSMLRRSGIVVSQKSSAEIATNKAWWALPAFGLLFFLMTLIMGPTLVDNIWEPPARSVGNAVDLNRPNSTANTAPANSGAATTGSQPSDLDSDASAEFLANALRSSEEQKRQAEQTRQETEAFVEQQLANEAQIRAFANQALLNVRIEKDTFFASLINSRGMLLMDRLHLSEAFNYEKRMRVTQSGGVEQVVEFIKPMVSQLESDAFEAKKVAESDRLGLALLDCNLQETLSYQVEFDRDLSVGAKVWIAANKNGNLEIIETYVNSSDSRNGVLYWTVSTDFGVKQNGLPVFNEYGALTGVLFHMSGGDTVLTFRQLREKEPQLFQRML